MEGQSAKRRRVYSLEPNKVVQATFTRNYMNYLVPALMKIKEKSSTEHNSYCDFQSVVKYEVDKAMVFSAQGFAWSNALKVKLQRDGVNVNSGSTGFVENKAGGEGSSKVCDQNEMVLPMDFFSSKSEAKNLMCKSKHNDDDMPQMGKDLTGENDEDEVINGQLRSLRRLIPGGEEMCHEQMVTELESYVSCLQMQVDILQCLAHESETS
ncbi:hypothetical protein SESBI_35235 [Sesbania bispinosa]|nr:hypothetical protein SESBI_35235 [Sesbania bispinosa]